MPLEIVELHDPVSLQLLQDSHIDVEGLLTRILAERLGRGIEAAITTADGSSKPEGIVTGAATGVSAGSATEIEYTDLLGLFHAVDVSYRQNARWGFNDNTAKQLRLMLDGNGVPLWSPDIRVGQPDTLLGKPFSILPSMANAATTTVPVIFGDFSYFWVRMVTPVRVLSDQVITTLSVQFCGYSRVDSVVVQDAALKKLTMS